MVFVFKVIPRRRRAAAVQGGFGTFIFIARPYQAGAASRTPASRQKSANYRKENGRQRASLPYGGQGQRNDAQYG
jgi:hypothetical protein